MNERMGSKLAASSGSSGSSCSTWSKLASRDACASGEGRRLQSGGSHVPAGVLLPPLVSSGSAGRRGPPKASTAQGIPIAIEPWGCSSSYATPSCGSAPSVRTNHP